MPPLFDDEQCNNTQAFTIDPLTKMHFATEKLDPSTKHKTTYEKQKNQLLLKMALTRVHEKNTRTWRCGYTFVDKILSMLGILRFLWVPVI
jgi:hypothetical protein